MKKIGFICFILMAGVFVQSAEAYTSIEIGNFWWDGNSVKVEVYRPNSGIGVTTDYAEVELVFHWSLGGNNGPSRTCSSSQNISLRKGDFRVLSFNPYRVSNQNGGSSRDYLNYVEIVFQKDLMTTERHRVDINEVP